jgi:hypothetical protein
MPDERKIVKYSVCHPRFKGVRGRVRPPVDKSESGRNVYLISGISRDHVRKLIKKLEQL